jgi:hypothetical protein
LVWAEPEASRGENKIKLVGDVVKQAARDDATQLKPDERGGDRRPDNFLIIIHSMSSQNEYDDEFPQVSIESGEL